MSLRDKLITNSTIKHTAVLTDSVVWDKSEMAITPIPMVNAALSGRIDGGMVAGLTIVAGASKHFKTMFGLLMASAYLKKYPDAVMIYYDNEFGAGKSYFKAFNIDTDRVIHTPITNIEELKFDAMKQLDALARGDHVVIFVDSIGNLASKKEVDDAMDQKSVADMTRAKALKSLFRMITPHLSIKDIPMVVVNHIYMEQGMYPKAIVSGGTGPYLSADTIWIITRAQEKDGDELSGYRFTINIEKSRFVKEKSKFPVVVEFGGGIQRWSGMVDLAIKLKLLGKPANGWYQEVDADGQFFGKKYRLADIEDDDVFWTDVFKRTDFAKRIKEEYTLVVGAVVDEDSDIDFSEDIWSDE